jgi:hypothetical protein
MASEQSQALALLIDDNNVSPKIIGGMAAESAAHRTIMIDAAYLKAHRTASSLRVKKGGADAR